MSEVQPDRLAIHYYKTEKVREGGAREEVFLSQELLMLKVYGIAAHLDVKFVREYYPEILALGQLPGAYVNNKPANAFQTLAYMQSLSNLDASERVSAEAADLFMDREGLLLAFSNQLSDALEYCLWVRRECYEKFTKPIILASTPRLVADLNAAAQRRASLSKFRGRDHRGIVDSIKKTLTNIEEVLPPGRKFIFSDSPMTLDIVLYSYLSPFLAIDEALLPFSIVGRLRTFLLDVDDWLWQVNATRHGLHEILKSPGVVSVTPQTEEQKVGEGLWASPSSAMTLGFALLVGGLLAVAGTRARV